MVIGTVLFYAMLILVMNAIGRHRSGNAEQLGALALNHDHSEVNVQNIRKAIDLVGCLASTCPKSDGSVRHIYF